MNAALIRRIRKEHSALMAIIPFITISSFPNNIYYHLLLYPKKISLPVNLFADTLAWIRTPPHDDLVDFSLA